MFYYVDQGTNTIVENSWRYDQELHQQLANDLNNTIYVIEGEHSGISLAPEKNEQEPQPCDR